MSKINDIAGILAIISARGPEPAISVFSLTKLFDQIVKKIYTQVKINVFFLIEYLLLLEYRIGDPYDVMYEIYWQQVFMDLKKE